MKEDLWVMTRVSTLGVGMGGGASPGGTAEEPVCDELSEPEQWEQFSRPYGTRGARACGSPTFETLGYSRWSLRDRHVLSKRAARAQRWSLFRSKRFTADRLRGGPGSSRLCG